MLRYFYLLLFLLLAIKWTLCYDYNSDYKLGKKHVKRVGKRDRTQHQHRSAKKIENNEQRSFELAEDKIPFAQIDVASFIQNPDEFAVDNNSVYETEAKDSTKTRNYDDYGSLLQSNSEKDSVKKSNKRPYLNPGEDKQLDLRGNSFSRKDTRNPRRLNLDSLSSHGLNNEKFVRNLGKKLTTSGYQRELYKTDLETNFGHKPEKKNVLKHLKLPFFSRNKTDARKLKKDEKRKILCFNCSKKKKGKEKSKDSETVNQETKEGKKEDLQTLSKVTVKNDDENVNEIKYTQARREKRFDYNGVRERQLKDLNEIQRKVDSVELLQPYQKKMNAVTR